MTRLIQIIVSTLFLLWLVSSCAVTPLPVPPTVDPEVIPDLIVIESVEGGVTVSGDDGAIAPGGSEIRITTTIPVDSAPEPVVFEETLAGEDGSFSVFLGGAEAMGVFYIEFLEEEGDLFVMAITPGASGVAAEVDPGPDLDDDGSPDRVDCAPADDTYGGQECP